MAALAAVEDALAGVMSWFEIEQAWLKTNDCGSATGTDFNVPSDDAAIQYFACRSPDEYSDDTSTRERGATMITTDSCISSVPSAVELAGTDTRISASKPFIGLSSPVSSASAPSSAV